MISNNVATYMIIDIVQYSAILNISTSGVRVETLQQVMIVVSGSYYSMEINAKN